MKRKIYILIVIVIYIVLEVFGIKQYFPTNKFDIDDIVRDADGNIYAVGGENNNVYIYKMDAYGTAQELHRCKGEAKEVETFCRYHAGHLFAGQVWYENGKQHFSLWMKAASDKRFERVWEKALDDDIRITDFHIESETMYVTGIDQQTEGILLYSYQNGNDQLVRFENDFIPVTVCWGNDGLYILSHDNHIYYADLNGKKHTSGIEDAVMLITDENGFYYQKKDSSDLTYAFYNEMGGYTYVDLGDVWNAQYSDRIQNNAVLVFKDGTDQLLIVNQDGTQGRYIESFQLSIGKVLKEAIVPFFIITIGYVAIIIMIYLFVNPVWKKRKLIYQTMTALIVFSGVWLFITLVSLHFYEIENEKQDRLFYAETCMTIQKGRMQDNPEIYRLHYEDYIGSQQRKIVEKIFSNNEIGNTWEAFFTREEIVYGYDNPLFIFSKLAAYGRRADTFYDADTINYIQKCMNTGENQRFTDETDGILYAMAITPIGEESQQLCLVSRVPVRGGEDTHKNLTGFYVSAVLGWVLVMVCIKTYLKKKWNHVEILVAQMDRVSKGDYHIDNRKVPDNEFGTMWTALERMCKNLQIQKHKKTEILDYIYQFAPKNFEILFSREKLQDIEIGETVQIPATMGMISIIDKDTLLTGKVQKQYVQYVNQLMEILFSQSESEQAVFLQNGSNLENVKVIFKEDGSALTAVRYSIDCIETLLGLTETKYDTKPFILLHTSQFRCGLAGGSKQVYPYVTSLEMETLSMYIDPLKRCDIRMVVTHNTWMQVKERVHGRFIGYVTSKDGKYQFHLYEILDVHAQSQRLGKAGNIENFEKALKLYYDNDFYLARSIFAEIVKACPDDGIARWYVFACEELFNREDNSNVRYELFRELL